MFRALAFLTKQPHLTMEEFIDYYENRHLPLVYSVSGDKLPTIYKRRYLRTDPENFLFPPGSGQPVEADVVTELGFEDRAAFDAWCTILLQGEHAARIAADEENFLVRSRTMVYIVEEHDTGK